MVRMTAVVLLVLASFLASPARAATTIVEYYNAALDHYFITWMPPEIAKLDAGTEIKGWVRTGKTLQTHTAAQGGTSPVCRYYIPPGLGDSHFFGRGTVECDATGAKNPSFVLEDPAFMHMFLPTAGTCPAGTTEVYRVFSNRPDANHRYMTDPAVRDEMIAKGWLAEGDGLNLVVMCAPPADTGPVTDFLPTADTTLAGAVNFGTVTIPAGVTVTVTDTLVLNATGPITIAGNLVGDCKVTSLGTTATLTVSGNIDNHCTTLPDDVAASLTLVGNGGYDFNGGGTVRSSGDVLVTNNLGASQTARIDATGLVAVPPSASPSARIARAGPYACRSVSRTWIAAPAKARNGANGTPRSGDGKRGSTWVLWCDDLGNGLIDRTTVTGQNGGDAGHATHMSNTGAEATGGAGGIGGALRVFVSGQLDIGTGNVFNTGSGGEGGDASATATANPEPAAAPSGTAVAGHGGAAGLVTIQSLDAMTIGSLTLNIGRGGAGGVAAATGADGAASTAARAAQVGGTGTAVGGDGGALPAATLSAKGNITGAGAVTVTGGPAGAGGFGDAMSGRGGNGGDAANKDGAAGGAVHARGGHGGNAQTRNLAGALVANGGDSGEALFRGGRGGDGFADCTLPMVAGGNGGRGGAATGGTFPGGTGIASGAAGITREFTVSNGGNGGAGFGPGKRGEAGSNGIQIAGGTDIAPPVFTPGVVGRACLVSVTVAVALDPLPSHEPFVGYSSIGFLVFRLDNDTGIVTITGDGTGKWIAVAGPYDAASGAFTATGSGTAAGFPSVPATFTGTLNRASGKLAGEVTLGGGGPGQLPQHSTSYTVTGTLVGPAP